MVKRTYDLSREYLRSLWNCLDDNEKAILIATSVQWAEPIETKRILWDQREPVREMHFRRLIDFRFIEVRNGNVTIGSPFLAYWIVIDSEQVDRKLLIDSQGRQFLTWLKSASVEAAQYIDKNKETLTKIAFEVLKGITP
jgi:hypothetical protein